MTKRDRLVERIADGLLTPDEARPVLDRLRAEVHDLQTELESLAAEPEQLDRLSGFQGINLADYSLEERRDLLRIIIERIDLRFDRMFITYNLFSAPGQPYVGRVDLHRSPAHNSKLRRR
jgi:hypothetical protein